VWLKSLFLALTRDCATFSRRGASRLNAPRPSFDPALAIPPVNGLCANKRSIGSAHGQLLEF
jgi:hypothetical protein